MDAFDQATEEFASTCRIEAPVRRMSKRERPAQATLIPLPGLSAAQPEFAQTDAALSPSRGASERERPADDVVNPLRGMPAAHQSASTGDVLVPTIRVSKRRRQSSKPMPPTFRATAGGKDQNTESQQDTASHSGRALGSGDSAQHTHATPGVCSPVAAGVPAVQVVVGTHAGRDSRIDERALGQGDTHTIPSPLVSEIIQLWRMRQRWHRAEKALILQGKALCRSWVGGDKAEANALYDRAAKGEPVDPAVAMALMPFLAAGTSFSKERAPIEKRLRKLAQASALWPWVSEVKGFGSLNLAALIGEAGEIAGYRNPSCLWKRMGLAVINGERQRKKADKEQAAVHGYNPSRRCVAYLLGDTLIKAGDGCRYRPVYAARRERTAETHPDWTKAPSHNAAARVMTKRARRELWSEATRVARAGAA